MGLWENVNIKWKILLEHQLCYLTSYKERKKKEIEKYKYDKIGDMIKRGDQKKKKINNKVFVYHFSYQILTHLWFFSLHKDE